MQPDAEQPQPRLRGPFIMPDGRPLQAFLESQSLRPPRGGGTSGGGSHKRRSAVKEPKEGWTKALPRAAVASAGAGLGSSVHSEAEQAEMYALSRVGHRKQRRWLNDKLLRDMAGTLTASDMSSLFKPVPFGEQRTTLWEQAAQPEHAALWDLFRSLDMDKQSRVLQKWEAHVVELQASPAAIQNPAIHAIAAWAGVSWKARQAMKRSSPSHVHSIEEQIMEYFNQEQDQAGDELVVSGLEDAFHRLIAHGLAEYHSLNSHSRVLADGSKEVVVRRRRVAVSGSSTGGSGNAATLAGASSPQPGDASAASTAAAGQQQEQPAVLAIACSDLLHILVDESQPLTQAMLHQAYCHPMHDSSSEAGDSHLPHVMVTAS